MGYPNDGSVVKNFVAHPDYKWNDKSIAEDAKQHLLHWITGMVGSCAGSPSFWLSLLRHDFDSNLLQNHRCYRAVVTGAGRPDFPDDIHATNDISERRIHLVELRQR